jgi:phytanoyl-CoA hydroxylase
MRVVIEPTIERHVPQLYRSDRHAAKVLGFEGVDAAALGRYEDQGYLVIAAGFSKDEMHAARETLTAMTRAEDPCCTSVYYEGAVREHLPGRALAHHAVDGNIPLEELALGDIGQQLPEISADIRARYVRKFAGFTATQPVLGALARNPSLLRAVEQVVGAPIREFQDMAMIKPPGGREKPWHQDHAYFDLPLETKIVGVWIALDTVTPQNGCMYVLAGGHKNGPRPHFMRRDWQICDTDILNSHTTCVPMEAGDVLLFDSKLPHGTPTNNSDEFRWAIQMHYVPADAVEVDERVRLENFGNEGKNVSC